MHGCHTSNSKDAKGIILEKNHQEERERGITRKDDYFEGVDAKADGEVINMHSSSPVVVVNNENGGRGSYDRPCASSQFQRGALKKKPISKGGTGSKTDLKNK